jgi:hypothetical protein
MKDKRRLGNQRRRGREVAGGVPRCHARETGIQEHRASYRFLSHQSKSTSSIRMLGTPFERSHRIQPIDATPVWRGVMLARAYPVPRDETVGSKGK